MPTADPTTTGSTSRKRSRNLGDSFILSLWIYAYALILLLFGILQRFEAWRGSGR